MNAPTVAARRFVRHYDDDPHVMLEILGCPYCGRLHVHGAGKVGCPVGAGDGHRMPHCVPISEEARRVGYVVREVDIDDPDALVSKGSRRSASMGGGRS